MQQFLGFAFHPTHVEKATREEITRTRQEEDSWGVIRKPHKLFPTGFERDPKIKEQPSKEEREWEVVDQAEFERGELEETTERDARAVQRKNESPAMSEDENFEYADDESPRALSEAEEEEEQEEAKRAAEKKQKKTTFQKTNTPSPKPPPTPVMYTWPQVAMVFIGCTVMFAIFWELIVTLKA